VLGLSWPEPREFDEDERAFVLTLGVMCAQAIMRAHLRAEQANQFKARLVATISHELRTPINAVVGYVDLLTDELDGPITAQQKDHLTRMRASGRHLVGLVEDLLGYARIEAGVETVRRDSFLLSDVVEQTLILIRPLAGSKGLPLRVSGVDAPVTLRTDRRKLCQILTNLLVNAVKFTTEGHVGLHVRSEGTAPASRVVFEVEDSGDGIAVENREHVFDVFWRANLGESNLAASSGLGLSVARQLARLLGGDVVVGSSNLGVGTTFVVSLPALQTS
jgi:signal transduction histidine kinase